MCRKYVHIFLDHDQFYNNNLLKQHMFFYCEINFIYKFITAILIAGKTTQLLFLIKFIKYKNTKICILEYIEKQLYFLELID